MKFYGLNIRIYSMYVTGAISKTIMKHWDEIIHALRTASYRSFYIIFAVIKLVIILFFYIKIE